MVSRDREARSARTSLLEVLDRILSLARETTGDDLAMSDALAEIEREAAGALEAAMPRA